MIILETESDVVLHRRRSKLSNVLCFLNTLNLPSPCSAQDDGFPNMKRETSLCLIGTQHESFKGASLLCPGEVPMDAYSPGLNCGEPDSVTSTSWWTLEESSWQQVMEPEPFERKLELNKPLGMNVSELSTPVVLCFTHRPSLWETQYYLLNTDTHFLYVFLPPPKTTVSFYEHKNLQIRWAKDIIRLD